MQHNIRRNKRVFEYLNQQLRRLQWNVPVTIIFREFIFENLSVSESKETLNYSSGPVQENILDVEAVLIETLKFIGLLEVSTNEHELRSLVERKKEIKYGRELTDFDKILKAIMTVPNKKEKE